MEEPNTFLVIAVIVAIPVVIAVLLTIVGSIWLRSTDGGVLTLLMTCDQIDLSRSNQLAFLDIMTVLLRVQCPFCHSSDVIRHGKSHNKQRYRALLPGLSSSNL